MARTTIADASPADVAALDVLRQIFITWLAMEKAKAREPRSFTRILARLDMHDFWSAECRRVHIQQ